MNRVFSIHREIHLQQVYRVLRSRRLIRWEIVEGVMLQKYHVQCDKIHIAVWRSYRIVFHILIEDTLSLITYMS